MTPSFGAKPEVSVTVIPAAGGLFTTKDAVDEGLHEGSGGVGFKIAYIKLVPAVAIFALAVAVVPLLVRLALATLANMVPPTYGFVVAAPKDLKVTP
jgi:hypothetical protein